MLSLKVCSNSAVCSWKRPFHIERALFASGSAGARLRVPEDEINLRLHFPRGLKPSAPLYVGTHIGFQSSETSVDRRADCAAASGGVRFARVLDPISPAHYPRIFAGRCGADRGVWISPLRASE